MRILTLALLLPILVAAQSGSNNHTLLKEYMQFLSIPNVYGDSANIMRNAEAVMRMMKNRGINSKLLRIDKPGAAPLVYGEVMVPGAKHTYGFYAHYDGQPVNPKQWAEGTAPFEPKLFTNRIDLGGKPVNESWPADFPESWRLYGRGSSDDKAGVFAIIAGYEAMIKAGKKPAANLKFIFEGEEEAGSIHLGEYFEKYTPLLKADLYVICDGPMHVSGRKQMVYGVRGDVNVDLKVYASTRPLHSGNYGNWAPNAAMRLAQLLAGMKDENGMVTIPGFYDDVQPLSKEEQTALQEIPDPAGTLRDELKMYKPDGGGKSFMQLLNMPTLNINGMSAANTGAMASNIIPADASAVIDLRLVKGTTVEGQIMRLKQYITSKGYYITTEEPSDEERKAHPLIAKLRQRGGGYPAQKTDMSLPIAQQVLKTLQSTTADKVIRLPTVGGSLPLYLFDDVLQSPPITIGIVNYDNNQHAENENVRVNYLFRGIATMAALLAMP